MKGDIIAIDLGTSRSVGTLVSDIGEIEALTFSDGDRTIPSVVKFGNGDEIVVGKIALRAAISSPNRVAQSAKRHIGTSWSMKVDGEKYSAANIESKILKKIMSRANDMSSKKPDKAMTSVPAYFGKNERKATKKAGRQAGFSVVDLIEEPVAGFLAGIIEGKKQDGNFLVYDLGGGTFDSSVLEVQDQNIDVISIEGVSKLGGQDFTWKIVNWIEEKYGEIKDQKTKQDVYDRAEKSKKELSTVTKTTMSVPLDKGLEHVDISRSKFEELINPLIEQTIEESQKAVETAGLENRDLDGVVVIGGSSRIPLVTKKLENTFGEILIYSDQPDTAVARGAMFKAANENNIQLYDQKGKILPEFYVSEMLAHSLGVETLAIEDGRKLNSKIIKKGEDLPAGGEATFTTEKKNQRNIKIKILEGESSRAKDCKALGESEGYKIKGIPPQPQGVPDIKVKMRVTEEGILKVDAEEKSSGENLTVEVKRDDLVAGGDKS